MRNNQNNGNVADTQYWIQAVLFILHASHHDSIFSIILKISVDDYKLYPANKKISKRNKTSFWLKLKKGTCVKVIGL